MKSPKIIANDDVGLIVVIWNDKNDRFAYEGIISPRRKDFIFTLRKFPQKRLKILSPVYIKTKYISYT
jgi:hypothetical protein